MNCSETLKNGISGSYKLVLPGFAKLSGNQTGNIPGLKLSQKVATLSQDPSAQPISQPCSANRMIEQRDLHPDF